MPWNVDGAWPVRILPFGMGQGKGDKRRSTDVRFGS